jgi:hypothetical protein
MKDLIEEMATAPDWLRVLVKMRFDKERGDIGDRLVSIADFIEKQAAALAIVEPRLRAMEEALSDCAEFLSDIDGTLALKCEAALKGEPQ